MNDIRPVIVRGSKVSLGVLIESDTEFLFSAINNPEVHRFLRNPGRIMYIGDEINWFRSLSEKSANDRHFAIIENDGMEIVGVIGVREIDWINGTGIIGYFLSQNKWGKGFAAIADSLTADICFNTLILRKLYVGVFELYKASAKALIKNGFSECGRFHKISWIVEPQFKGRAYREKTSAGYIYR